MYRTRLALFLYEKVRGLFAPTRGQMVSGVVSLIARIPKPRIKDYLTEIDAELSEHLSGNELLEMAEAINALDPAYIDAFMPALRDRLKYLARAKEVADLFQPEALDRLIAALQAERNGTHAGAQGGQQGGGAQ